MDEGNFIIKSLKDDTRILTKNKIYEFINGYTMFDNGKSSYYKNFNDLLKRNHGWEDTIQQLIVQQTSEIHKNNNEDRYDKLYFSPISYIRLNGMNEDCFTKSLKEDKAIVFASEQSRITYDRIPKLIEWLKNVYDYCTELKNKVEYVDFNTAKEYMNNSNKAMFEDETYYIKNNELFCEDTNSAVALKLRAIESDKWILI
jgi:hypothetical protein